VINGPPLQAVKPDTVTSQQLVQLYQELEGDQMLEWESALGIPVALYTQQIAGIAAQPQAFDLYHFLAADADEPFQSIYTAASTARQIQTLGRTLGDSLWIGIGKVWEAAAMGDAASIWGALPYEQAFDRAHYPHPKFDPQPTVYQIVDAQLDSAIRWYLAARPRAQGGPGSAELIYQGQPAESLATIYTEVAHTLRARYDLHQAGRDPSYYATALEEAQQGIADPRHDWNWYNSVAGTANNATYLFVTGRSAGELGPSATLINLMHQRIAEGLDANQDRLNFYFVSTANASLSCDTTCTGYRPGGDTAEPGGGGTSDFNLLNYGTGFRQPYVTWTETQLIVAEAALSTGDPLLAEHALTAVRSREVYGADVSGDILAAGGVACGGACTFAAQRPIPATLRNIIEEKYIDLFLSTEVWSDFRRTCLPYIAAAPATVSASLPRPGGLPVRFPYGSTIVATDPNVPNVSPSARNADSPRVCPAYAFTGMPRAY
jgi:starch-binding outer membrane protein, SusD/RagB family